MMGEIRQKNKKELASAIEYKRTGYMSGYLECPDEATSFKKSSQVYQWVDFKILGAK